MAAWMLWTLAIPLFVIAFCFFVMAIGLIVALARVTSVLRDIEDKLHALDPLCRVIYRLGDIVDHKVEDWEEGGRCKGLDIADWILWVISFVKKLRRK